MAAAAADEKRQLKVTFGGATAAGAAASASPPAAAASGVTIALAAATPPPPPQLPLANGSYKRSSGDPADDPVLARYVDQPPVDVAALYTRMMQQFEALRANSDAQMAWHKREVQRMLDRGCGGRDCCSN